VVRVLEKEFMVLATDVTSSGTDFPNEMQLSNPAIRGIITNPPYSDAEALLQPCNLKLSGICAMTDVRDLLNAQWAARRIRLRPPI
jgi:hypothetical protein